MIDKGWQEENKKKEQEVEENELDRRRWLEKAVVGEVESAWRRREANNTKTKRHLRLLYYYCHLDVTKITPLHDNNLN